MGDTFEVCEAGADERRDVQRLLARANDEHRKALPAGAFDPYLAMVLDVESSGAPRRWSFEARVDPSRP